MMIDALSLFQLLIDFGLVVLILMVQLTIYPSFLYYKTEDLVRWHQKYTGAIAMVVGPLMLAQLLLSIYVVFVNQQYLLGGIHLTLVLATWIATAIQFVPIHNRIGKSEHTNKDLQKLVHHNWIRVILWILILLLGLFQNYLA
ncbi:hypothetical protein [uncultured Dokdonia sp.]|uniref:hypothetical protein n=1 Tax=uncultured Dokdonia sp. TaxID=575653 RepID=UPI0030EC7EC2|tara:strand:- start:288792 stop:289220 length:429 start_codon:yes stop_codon:yes gene_type:complete